MVFINCLFTGNYAPRAGAIGADGSSSPKLINCTITNNSAEDVGAGFYTGSYNPDGSNSNDPILINCLVWGNRTEWGGPADIRVWHTNFFSISHSNIGVGFTSYGDGVISNDPLLADSAARDYRLGPQSPCINAGVTSDALDTENDIPDFDIDGNPRDNTPDIGCYEFSAVACETYNLTETASICSGGSYTLPNGTEVTEAGEYTSNLTSKDGCDSIIVTTVTVVTSFSTTEDVTICSGNSYTLPNGTEVAEAGEYTSNLTSKAGCDSTVITTLTIVDSYSTTTEAIICNGGSYTLPDGTQVTEEGEYISNLKSETDCDSIITTMLTVVEAFSTTTEASICNGNSYTLPDGQEVDIAGTYTTTLTSQNDCDSIVTTTLTIIEPYEKTENISICEGETYTIPDGTEISAAGTYTSSFTSVQGCDSVIITELVVNNNPTAPVITQNGDVLTSNITDGNQWYVNNEAIANAQSSTYTTTAEGDYYTIVTNDSGCVSERSNIITIMFTNVNDLDKFQLTVFPNPASDFVSIKGLSQAQKQIRVRLMDVSGNFLRTINTDLGNTFDISDLSKGIYFLEVTLGNEIQTVRIVKN